MCAGSKQSTVLEWIFCDIWHAHADACHVAVPSMGREEGEGDNWYPWATGCTGSWRAARHNLMIDKFAGYSIELQDMPLMTDDKAKAFKQAWVVYRDGDTAQQLSAAVKTMAPSLSKQLSIWQQDQDPIVHISPSLLSASMEHGIMTSAAKLTRFKRQLSYHCNCLWARPVQEVLAARRTHPHTGAFTHLQTLHFLML